MRRPHTTSAPRALLCALVATSLASALSGCGAGAAGGTAGETTTASTDTTTQSDSAVDGTGAARADAGVAGDTTAATQPDTAAAADTETSQADAAHPHSDAGQAQLDSGPAAVDTGSPSVDGPLLSHWGPKSCATSGPPVGFAVGERLGDIAVHDCDTGAPRTLDEVCGSKATWLFVAHSHCPTCKATASYTASVAKDLADKDVAIVHIIYIDDGQTCPSWRKKYGLEGLPNVRVFLDKTGASWAKIKIKSYTAPHALMTKDRVITYKNHGLSSAGVKTLIDQALAKAK